MKKSAFKNKAFSNILIVITPCLLTLIVVAMALYGLDQAELSSRAEGLRTLENGIRRAVITCYAVEGSYPESVSYITEHYGVYIDASKYAVHYEIFASNILPVITVIELNRD